MGRLPPEGRDELLAAALAASARRLAPAAEAADAAGRVLVIDDDADNRALLKDLLALAGHEVYLAESGARGLKLARGIAVDLVVLDLLMPDMNGIDVLEALRGDPKLADLPVLLISGIDDSTLIGQCLRAGASDYIRKPYDATILAARVAATLERKRLRDRERRFVAQLDEEKRRAEALLGNILPEALVDRLGRGERSVAERFDAVTVLFADIAGFTSIAARLPAGRLVADLDRMVSAFDRHATELGVEKIKTVGDAYLAVAGLPEPIEGHADLAAALAVRMVRALRELAPELGTAYELRCGLHTGPVVAGVIGTHKFSYDVWGDTVNIASRLQTLAAPGEILLSGATRAALRPQVRTTQLGPVELRGRGVIETHRLEG
jgi:class 3 adenylate cyclase